ncbi:MAG: transporter associated domain-containing protein, partial [Ardenticatenaceae bacterium]
IQDEYDTEEAAFVQVDRYEAIVSGRLDIDDLNHDMDLDLPTDENDTVGGLIYSALGRVPLVGDEVRIGEADVTFHVTAMAGRRIMTARVLVAQPEEGGAAEVADDEESNDATPSARGGAEVGASRLMFW